jgi:hypothetical protein
VLAGCNADRERNGVGDVAGGTNWDATCRLSAAMDPAFSKPFPPGFLRSHDGRSDADPSVRCPALLARDRLDESEAVVLRSPRSSLVIVELSRDCARDDVRGPPGGPRMDPERTTLPVVRAQEDAAGRCALSGVRTSCLCVQLVDSLVDMSDMRTTHWPSGVMSMRELCAPAGSGRVARPALTADAARRWSSCRASTAKMVAAATVPTVRVRSPGAWSWLGGVVAAGRACERVGSRAARRRTAENRSDLLRWSPLDRG